MSSAELPQELVEFIIDNIQGKQELKNCALVSNKWRSRCQRRLFSTVAVDNRPGYSALNPHLNLLEASHSHLVNYVRTLSLRGVDKDPNQLETAKLLSLLVKLDTLHLRTTWFKDKHICSELRSALFDSIRSNIKHLHITGSEFPRETDLTDLCDPDIFLESLHFHDVLVKHSKVQTMGRPADRVGQEPRKAMTVNSLVIRYCDNNPLRCFARLGYVLHTKHLAIAWVNNAELDALLSDVLLSNVERLDLYPGEGEIYLPYPIDPLINGHFLDPSPNHLWRDFDLNILPNLRELSLPFRARDISTFLSTVAPGNNIETIISTTTLFDPCISPAIQVIDHLLASEPCRFARLKQVRLVYVPFMRPKSFSPFIYLADAFPRSLARRLLVLETWKSHNHPYLHQYVSSEILALAEQDRGRSVCSCSILFRPCPDIDSTSFSGKTSRVQAH
ncbi:hypothetical protein ONZ45_g14939 [Pleurotus djamor]|nr:hypothetical protein ONZ45_g14939 [Pleurotus djamor]